MKKMKSSSIPADSDSLTAVEILKLLEDQTLSDLNNLYVIWRTRNFDLWSCNLDLYQKFGERFLDIGEPLIAYDVVSEGLKCFTQDIRLRQLLALSLARGGVTEQANAILLELFNEGCHDEETMGLLARTYKDLWMKTNLKKYLSQAIKYYKLAYQSKRGFWTGINVATLSLLQGNTKRASAIATPCSIP